MPSVPSASPATNRDWGFYIGEDTGLIGQRSIGGCAAVRGTEIAEPLLSCGVIGAEEVDDSRAAEHVIEVSNRFDGLCHSVNGSYFQRDVDQVETCR